MFSKLSLSVGYDRTVSLAKVSWISSSRLSSVAILHWTLVPFGNTLSLRY